VTKNSAAGMLEKLLIGDASLRALVHTLKFKRDADVWQAVREFADSVPPLEWQRRSRLARRELQRIDTSHPPTQFRVDLIRGRTARAPKVVLNSVRADTIDAELAVARDKVARSLR
jgi:hypothetical protein